jgi:hypothetical protein
MSSSARRIGPALAIVLGVLALHTFHVWGYTGVFWGDIGRWSHEVERFASGELPYRDFQWHYPPLGLWVEGTLASVLGTNRLPLSLITISLATGIVSAFVYYSRDVLARVDVAVATICLVLALSYAQTNGAPLPLGIYSPAAIVGALWTANAARLFARTLNAPRRSDGAWIAVNAALAVLSKQDFWLPAAFLVGATFFRERRLGPPLIAAGVTLGGVVVIVATAGFGVLLPLLGGFGHAQLAGGQGFPSWERLTVDVLVLALVAAGFTTLASIAYRRLFAGPLVVAGLVALVAGGIHIMTSLQTALPPTGTLLAPTQEALSYHLERGAPLLRPAIGWLRTRLGQTPIPVLLPPVLLLLTALRWQHLPHPRRVVIALLLGLAVALRARRAFEATEWFEFLLTVPVVLASAELLLAPPPVEGRRLRGLTLGTLAALALWAYVAHGRGVGTGRSHRAVVETPRGTVRWRDTEARDFRRVKAALDSLDPAGTRPVFAFGFAGGWNYFLERRNPFPFTQDFFFSAFDADSVLALPRPGGLLLIDNPAVHGLHFGAATFALRRWEQPRVSSPYLPYDRPRFERLRGGCNRVPVDSTMFAVYACP